ncbi:MAG: hypothetical protein C7B47_17700, partial [Sulfobacillus thermosulfidooxidans]
RKIDRAQWVLSAPLLRNSFFEPMIKVGHRETAVHGDSHDVRRKFLMDFCPPPWHSEQTYPPFLTDVLRPIVPDRYTLDGHVTYRCPISGNGRSWRAHEWDHDPWIHRLRLADRRGVIGVWWRP